MKYGAPKPGRDNVALNHRREYMALVLCCTVLYISSHVPRWVGTQSVTPNSGTPLIFTRSRIQAFPRDIRHQACVTVRSAQTSQMDTKLTRCAAVTSKPKTSLQHPSEMISIERP
jgi:hypothetical protein